MYVHKTLEFKYTYNNKNRENNIEIYTFLYISSLFTIKIKSVELKILRFNIYQ